MLKRLIFALAVICGLFFLAWWEYSDVSMQYPRSKLLFRTWYWRHFGDPFDVEARRIAGHDSVNCSNSLQYDSSAVLNCVSAAQEQHRGVILRYNISGKDSSGVSGIVGASDGRTYDIAYDVWNGFVKAWERRCPEPVKISAIRDYRVWDIHCLPLVKSENEVKVLRDDWAEQVGKKNYFK